MQEQQSGLAALAPGKRLDRGPAHIDEAAFRRQSDRVFEPLRSRGLFAAERRKQVPPVVSDGLDLVHS